MSLLNTKEKTKIHWFMDLVKPNWMKVTIFIIFLLFVPIPYYDPNESGIRFSAVGDYQAINDLLRGNLHQEDFQLKDYFNIYFLQVFIIGFIVSYLLASVVIHFIELNLARHKY
ncbi:MAG: hypothetical protein V1740_07455 [Candidatus Woesearchaeota archaeon]